MCEKGQEQRTTQSNSTSSVGADPRAQSVYDSILNRASGVASTPYQSYTGPLTAGINSQQATGINNLNGVAGYASPYLDQAQGLFSQASNPVGDGDIQRWMNPYTQSVVDATQNQFNTQNASQQADLKGNLISQGALGGNRSGVLSAELAGQQQRNQAPVIAGLYSSGYGDAVKNAFQQQQSYLGAGNAIAGYGLQGQNAALNAAGQQIGAGNLLNQNQQAGYDAAYKQYLQQQAYPFQTAQWYANIAGGVAPQYGSTTNSNGTGVSTQPAPQQWAQIAGLGVSAASLFSDERVKEGVEQVGRTFDGQPIYKFRYKGQPQTHMGLMAQDVERRHPDAVGQYAGVKTVDYDRATDDAADRGHFAKGGVAGFDEAPYAGAESWVPDGKISLGHGPAASSYQQQTPGFGTTQTPGLDDLMKQAAGYAKDHRGMFNGPMDIMPSGMGFSPSQVGTAFPGGSGGVNVLGGFYADGGAVMSDADPGGVVPGAQYASSQFQMRPMGNGQVQVVNVRTGQVVYTGTAAGASNAQASASQGQRRAAGGGVMDEDELPARTFEDRSIPVERAITEGVFDPVGKNSADFKPDLPGVAGFEPPMPRPRPIAAGMEPAGPLPPQITGPKDVAQEDTASPALGYAGEPPARPFARDERTAGFEPSPAAAADAPNQMGGFNPLNLSDKARMALIAAGLRTAASRNPSALGAIGEGGLAGIGSYAQAQTEERKALSESQKLARDAEKAQQDLALRTRAQVESERHNKSSEKQAAANAEKEKWTYLGASDDPEHPGSVMQNATTGETRVDPFRVKEKGGKFVPAGSYMGADNVLRPLVMDQTTGRVVDPVTGKPPPDDAKIEGKGPSVTDEDAKALATRYVKTGDRTILQGLGTTGAAKSKVNHYISQVQKELGVTDEDLGTRVAEWEGRKAGQRTLGTQEAKMGSAAMEAEGAIKLARGIIEKVPRTGFLPLNKLIEGYSKNTLNPDQAELYARAQAIVNTYSAVMSRGANVTTDSSRHHANELLNTAGDKETWNRVLNTMQQEIDMAKKSPERMREFYRKEYGAKSEATGDTGTTAPALPANRADWKVGGTYLTNKGALKWDGERFVAP